MQSNKNRNNNPIKTIDMKAGILHLTDMHFSLKTDSGESLQTVLDNKNLFVAVTNSNLFFILRHLIS